MRDTFATATSVHEGKYDYALVEYKSVRDKVTILCPEHGPFHQRWCNHYSGIACPKCSKPVKTHDVFVKDARAKHGDTYEYPEPYKGTEKHLLIRCHAHGAFLQTPTKHLQGSGCPRCREHRKAETIIRKAREKFVKQASGVHEGKYGYQSSIYLGTKTHVEVTCPKHGSFEQNVSNHLRGAGCPTCGHRISRANREIATFIETLGVEVLQKTPLPEQKKRKVDVFLPGLGVAIEYHGLRWHSTAVHPDVEVRNMHRDKRLACEAAGWRYVALYEDEWRDRRGLCESYLRNLLGKATSLHARKLRVEVLTSAQARMFYDTHHFFGAGTASGRHMGLVDATGIHACMTFATTGGRSAKPMQLLSRYATDGHSIPGGAQRLFKALRGTETSPIYSYIDHDKFTGGVYERLGFVFDETLAPDYWTIWSGKHRRHKTATTRARLASHPEFDPALTEYENTQKMQFYRIYDSGKSRVAIQ